MMCNSFGVMPPSVPVQGSTFVRCDVILYDLASVHVLILGH